MKKHIAVFRDEIKNRFDKEEKYREMLFRRGYLLTDSEILNTKEFPFYDKWKHVELSKYNLYV